MILSFAESYRSVSRSMGRAPRGIILPMSLPEISPIRIPVESSVLRAVGYEPRHRRLRAEFCSGAVYAYEGVPHTIFADLVAAPSKGSFFNRRIRNDYNHKRLTESA